MKKLLNYRVTILTFLFFFIGLTNNLSAQVRLPSLHDSLFSTYYHQRHSFFKSMPATKGDIVFLGNSITDGGEWSELFANNRMKNRGISGDISAGVLNRLDEVVKRKPSKIFLLIGTNDLARGISSDSVVKNIMLIAAYTKQESPATKLYVQSILPVNNSFGKFGSHTNKGEQIKLVNKQLKDKAPSNGYRYIDLHTPFSNENGKLKEELTNDGLHLKGEAYLLWKHLIFEYVFDVQQQPSLIPLPQQIKWNEDNFPLYNCKTILIKDNTLLKEGLALQKEMNARGLSVTIKDNVTEKENYIFLRLGKVEATQLPEEAYHLEVAKSNITVTASTAHGIFNGLQTLYQLMRDNGFINGCTITDWPAFSWRGYMIDVGRNYQSMDLLKQQIDVMAKYKLNIFHFHPTEDIAWRIAIKQYPQLTAPEHMLRNKGMYYSEADIKELIAYCKERHITFVPEIDMPGHSAAFKRAMKTDMQSDSGLMIVKNILKEFIQTYDVAYIHIGADEVKITDKKFVPEVTAYIEGLGKKVIGWQPGGNFTDKTIRQLWMDDNAHLSSGSNLQFIDSRHLYLNHIDPLETVVTIFNRKIGDKEKGDASLLGGTICMWPDRAVANENDVLRMNAVYPGIIAFGERSWLGGGQAGWIANISDGNEKAFAEFENRLLEHKEHYFKDKPFAYVKQSDISWKLFGPYENGGDLSKKFSPELSLNDNELKSYKTITGGTVVLHHWWAPLIKGAIQNPDDSATWYATTKIWSDEEKIQSFWIGFNNLSRSPATDSPPLGVWDDKQSAVWVNGNLIEPPHWKRGGQKGNSEIPLTDEGYEYREPTKILLKKGWNTILIKVPVGSFKGKDWQNPVKWMFTFVPVHKQIARSANDD